MDWIILFIFWIVLALENPIIDLLKYILIIYALYSTWGDIKSFELMRAFENIFCMIVLFVPPIFFKDKTKTKEKKC
ncbi:hypothetical protein P6P37_11865 [Clostridium perfringens]|uniref:hypothetical protein n=1 Tax=Clostridium perfringens TaxID=1502 RepID=UPI0028CFA3BA|nr:hypothetical protein [Clostridium perfringens]MDK0553488.1 hypothetical protein [Clostridium perfringens]MDT7932690.1 hypothetical protein [Clostridium perfringens]MDT7956646.1 hypothetical protein [Clostridium perfringens]